MADSRVTFLPVRRFGATSRRDPWWGPSLATFLGFSAFIVYSTWAGYSNANYEFGPYLSPMYSPLLFGPSPHAWFGGPAQPGLVAALSALLGGGARPVGAGRLPADLLLLPGRLLQVLLGGSSRVRGRGAAKDVPRRAPVPARHPEHSSLLLLRRDRLHRGARDRRVEGDVVSGGRRRHRSSASASARSC